MSNRRSVSITLEIRAIPSGVDSFNYEVFTKYSRNRPVRSGFYPTEHTIYAYHGDISGIARDIQEVISELSTVTSTDLPPQGVPAVKPLSNPVLSENSGIG